MRSLTELHGGRVSATSGGLGKGSQFTVELPLAADAGADAELSTGGTALRALPGWPQQRERRVLVVDDNQDAAQILAELLDQLGFEVQVAHDGPSALAAATAFGPHICLLDIIEMLSKMS